MAGPSRGFVDAHRAWGRPLLLSALALLLLLLLNSQASGDPSPGPRIVGGIEVDPPGRYPFMVALVHHGGDAWADQFCGGSLISPEWVLTAAHCVFGETASPVDLIIGRHDLDSDEGERIPARRIIRHPAYDDVSFTADIALIRLVTPVGYAPVLLPADGSLEAAGTMLTVTGWGNTESVPEWPTELREVQLPVVGDAECLEIYADYANPPAALMLCAGATGMDSCQGDSGGPLFGAEAEGFTQVGIVSAGEGCGGAGFPGMYTSVAAFTTWITNQSGVVPGPPTGSEMKCLGVVATIVGTEAGEIINGGPGDDVIAALGGNDVVNGQGGDDRICGGAGADQITGGAGNDTLVGEAGDDLLDGGDGADKVIGGVGTDTCYGETKETCELPGGSGPTCLGLPATGVGTTGPDTIIGTAGDDVLVGLGGNDIINGYGGNDRICGGPGNDRISGGPGNDQVQGNAGDDTISGGRGADILKGGTGADRIKGNAGRDRLFGEAGNDNLDGGLSIDRVTGGLGTDTCYGETKATCLHHR
jgi:hypothetical protein